MAENTEQKFYHLSHFEVYSTVALLHVSSWGPSGRPMGEDSEMCQSPAQKAWAKNPTNSMAMGSATSLLSESWRVGKKTHSSGD